MAAFAVGAVTACAGRGDSGVGDTGQTSGVGGGGAPVTSTCDVGQPARLSAEGLGALRIGATVEDVGARCAVLADTTLPGAEGQPERRLTVVTGSVNTVATVVDGKVWRIEVDSPRFRTTDSLGVGSTVAQLRAPGARLALGEGAFVLRDDHCGLSFRLASGSGAMNARTLDAVPDSVRVERVLITGCQRPD